MQLPVDKLQHAPGCGQGSYPPQEVPYPRHLKCSLAARQSISDKNSQWPSRKQQAPAGGGQGFGAQAVHSACQTRPPGQDASVVTEHDPSAGLQHAPAGPAQLFGSQVPHSGCQTAGGAHAASVVT